MPNESRVPEIISSQREPARALRIFTFKVTELIWLLFGILEVSILLRVCLKLIGANPTSPIISLIYGLTHLVLFPFTGMLSSPTAGYLELELSSLFAMLIYALVAWALERSLWLIFYRPRGPVIGITETKTRKQHHTLQ